MSRVGHPNVVAVVQSLAADGYAVPAYGTVAILISELHERLMGLEMIVSAMSLGGAQPQPKGPAMPAADALVRAVHVALKARGIVLYSRPDEPDELGDALVSLGGFAINAEVAALWNQNEITLMNLGCDLCAEALLRFIDGKGPPSFGSSAMNTLARKIRDLQNTPGRYSALN